MYSPLYIVLQISAINFKKQRLLKIQFTYISKK